MLTTIDLIFIGILFIILPIIALVHILPGKFEDNDKMIWSLVVIFIPVLGPILYFLIGRKHRIN
jgi:hypothetical protein